MNNKKGTSFPLIIIATVLGWTIFKQLDFENLRFEKPIMAVIDFYNDNLLYFKEQQTRRGKITAANS
jgi:hypothetical protein